MKAFWTQTAYRRLEEIYTYIEKENPESAERWLEKILKRLAQVKDFPKSGRPVPEMGSSSVLELVLGNYRVIYKIKNDAVFILTVRHFKQILPMGDLEG